MDVLKYEFVIVVVLPLWSFASVILGIIVCSARKASVTKTIFMGFVATTASGVAFAVLSGLFGYAMGTLAPEHLRSFAGLPSLGDDPSQLSGASVGLILGFVVECSTGLFVGSTIFVARALYKSRRVAK